MRLLSLYFSLHSSLLLPFSFCFQLSFNSLFLFLFISISISFTFSFSQFLSPHQILCHLFVRYLVVNMRLILNTLFLSNHLVFFVFLKILIICSLSYLVTKWFFLCNKQGMSKKATCLRGRAAVWPRSRVAKINFC